MEYKEGRCPNCNESMQIPVGRSKIICMFCGQQFSVEESRKAGAAVYEAELKAFGESADAFFIDVDKTIQGFQRNEYEGSFQRYLEKQQDNLNRICTVMQEAPDQEDARMKVAEIIVESGKNAMDTRKTRIGRESVQMTMNMYMVTFLLPAILSIEEEKYAGLADEICGKWAAAFKNSKIQAASYDTLREGFRRKLCYITTAVCEGLHKPEDCYELNLLKSYRDEYLSASPEGEALIAQYYDMAPTIVKRLNKRKDHEAVYRFLYETYISPCVHLIEENRTEECRKKYQEMVEMLKAEYM